MRRLRALLAQWVSIVALVLGLGWSAGAQTPTPMPKAMVQVVTSQGARHAFTVEVAKTDPHRHQGLMFRWHLDAGEGMLFVFDEAKPISMWMKNTFIPLTMLFVAEDGRIVRIVDKTVPLSEASIHSGEPVTRVLELAGGTASKLALKAGDHIQMAP